MSQSCPYCHEIFTAHTGVNTEDTPKPGNLSVCAFCGGLMKINIGMQFIKVPAIEEIRIKIWEPQSWKLIDRLRKRFK